MMKRYRKPIQIAGAMALAALLTTGAYAQMGGGGMMGGPGSGGGMMGGFGSGSGNGQAMFGEYGRDSRNDNGYAPGTNDGPQACVAMLRPASLSELPGDNQQTTIKAKTWVRH